MTDESPTLQAVSEQHEAVAEELRSANEEAQSANEEMQSVNEEIETSKEELEATNEPLIIHSIEDITEPALAGETRSRLAAIVESTDDAIISTTLESVITTWNRGAEMLFGYSAAEITGLPVTVLIPEDRLGEEPEIIASVRAGEPVEHFETVRRRKDGSHLHVSVSSSPIFNESGVIVGASKIARDITARKETEDALRESEARYRAIGESIDYGVWVCAPDGRNLYASESFLNLVGITQEQCSSFGWGEVLHPEDAERTMVAWQECVASGGIWDMEHRFRGVDGEWHPILARGVPVKNERGEVVSWAGINLDISRQKDAEKSLRHSEQRFRTAAGVVSSIIWTNNAEGKMEGEQPGWGNFTGQTREDYQGYGWAQAVHPDDAQPTIDAWDRAVAAKGMFVHEHRVRRADGEWRLCSIRAVPIVGVDGAILEWVGVHTDITERRRSDANLVFLAALSQDLVRLETVDEILRSVGARIGAHFTLSLCNFVEVREAAGESEVTHEWRRDGIPSTLGTYQLSEWFTPEFQRTLCAGELFVVRDTETDPRVESEKYKALEMRAFVCVPLVRDGGWKFMFNFHNTKARDWREDELDLIRDVTGRIWARLEKANAEEALREGNRRLDLLAQTGRELILGEMPGATMLQPVLERVCAELDADLAFTFFTGDEPETLRLAATVGVTEEGRAFYAGIRFGEYLCGTIAARGERVIVEKLQQCGSPEAVTLCRAGVRGYAGFPMVAQGRLLGTIAFASTRRDFFRPEELLLIETVSDQVAATLDRARTSEALRASEARANGIIQSIADGFITMDVDWRITYLSARGAEILAPLQKTTENVIGKVFWEEFPATVGMVIEESFHRAAREQVPEHFEFFYPPLDRWFEFRAYPSPLCITIYFLDITERIQYDEALREALMALRERTESLELFNKVAVGRELRMIELKKEINRLHERHGEPAPYPLDFESNGVSHDV